MPLSETEALLTLVAGPDLMSRLAQGDIESNFDRLPRNRQGYPNDDANEAAVLAHARAAGFVIGEVLDDLFIAVTPPPGWRMERTDHYMYSRLFDAQGRERGTQMFKAAAYDRDANFRFDTRYTIHEDKPENWFELSHPRAPEPLFNVVKRRVEVKRDKGDNYPAYHYNSGDEVLYDLNHYSRGYPRRYKVVEVKEYLPEDQQPKRAKAVGYDVTMSIKDRATGEIVWRGEPFHYDSRDENPRAPWDNEPKENAARKAAAEWADANLPEWRDPAAYWDRP